MKIFTSMRAGASRKGKYAAAGELFAKGISLDPKKEKLYLKIGQAYVKKDDAIRVWIPDCRF